ncbi:MAG TPA: hypothetical protein PKK95_02585 [Vicinamibacterales bacterium]|nr:hypothetical protein [Vicinamibacterales bacterium]
MIGDFDSGRRVVLAGGRRYLCRPPTVRTVDRVLTLFLTEVSALHAAAADVSLTPEEILRVLSGDRRLAEVLDTCVELWGAAPGELVELLADNRDLQVELALAVVGLCDAAWIWSTLHLAEALEAQEQAPIGPEDATTQDAVLCRIAAAFGRPPHELLDWPYGAFVRAVQLGYGSDPLAAHPAMTTTLADLEV